MSDIAAVACELGWHFSIWNFLDGPGFNYFYFDQNHGTNYIGTINTFWNCSLTPIEETNVSVDLPRDFELFQNYPNPFNPSTLIRYQLPVEAHVILRIFNVLGQEVVTLVDEEQAGGRYEVRWDASGYAGGVYFYRLLATDIASRSEKAYSETRKLVLVK